MIGIIEQELGLVQCPACAALYIKFSKERDFKYSCCGSEFDHDDNDPNNFRYGLRFWKWFLKICFRDKFYWAFDKVDYGEIPYRIWSFGFITFNFGKLYTGKYLFNKAAYEVAYGLKQISQEDFDKLLEKHNGDISNILLETKVIL